MKSLAVSRKQTNKQKKKKFLPRDSNPRPRESTILSKQIIVLPIVSASPCSGGHYYKPFYGPNL
jgi:hypothetical protein